MWLLANAVSDSCNEIFTPRAPDRSSVLRHLFRYVAGSCHLKILSRLTDKRISFPFLKALYNIDVEKVPSPFQSSEHPSNHSSSRHGSSRRRPAAPTSIEISNDHEFLHHFILQAKTCSLLGTLEIPNLSRMADMAVPPSRIYDEDTWKEVHEVLVFILKGLISALRRIQTLTDAPSASNSEELKQKLQAAQMYAYGLLRLVRGHALKMHLYNFSDLLDSHLPTGQGESERVSRAVSEEYSEDLDAIEPGDHTGWLQLSLSHFEAIEIIISFLTDRALKGREKSQPTSITVRILASPLSSGKMYPWRELFVHPTFPADAQDVYLNTAMIDNIGLRDWLEEAASDATRLEAQVDLISSANQEWTSGPSERFSRYKSIHDSISALVDGDLSLTESERIGLDKSARNLRDLLEEWYLLSKVENDITDGLLLLKCQLSPLSQVLSKLSSSAYGRWIDQSRRLSNYESVLHSVTKLAVDGGLPTIKLESDSDSEAVDIDLNQTVHKLVALLDTWLKDCQQKSQLETKIGEGLDTLESELLPPLGYTYLTNLTKLDKETEFTGATHCEACLATFLNDTEGGRNSKYADHLVTPPLKTILQALQVGMLIHVYS